jgi:hypothetical protein
MEYPMKPKRQGGYMSVRKIVLYMDIEPWMLNPLNNWEFTAREHPLGGKSKTGKRYRIEFEIQDPHEPDEIIGAIVEDET